MPPEIPVSPVSLNHEPVAGGAGKYNDSRPVAYDEVELNITYGKFGKLSNVLTRFLPGSLSYSYAHRDVSPMLGDDIHHIVLIGAPFWCN